MNRAPRNALYTAVQGGYGPDRARDAEHEASQKRSAEIEKDLKQVKILASIECEHISALNFRLFNLSVDSEVREGQAKPAALADQLVHFSKEHRNIGSAELSLLSCTWIYRNKGEKPTPAYFRQFITELEKPKYDILSSEFRQNIIQALGQLSHELTWHTEYLFNPGYPRPR